MKILCIKYVFWHWTIFHQKNVNLLKFLMTIWPTCDVETSLIQITILSRTLEGNLNLAPTFGNPNQPSKTNPKPYTYMRSSRRKRNARAPHPPSTTPPPKKRPWKFPKNPQISKISPKWGRPTHYFKRFPFNVTLGRATTTSPRLCRFAPTPVGSEEGCMCACPPHSPENLTPPPWRGWNNPVRVLRSAREMARARVPTFGHGSRWGYGRRISAKSGPLRGRSTPGGRSPVASVAWLYLPWAIIINGPSAH